MTDIEATHRPLNADTLELDTMAPRDREVVEKILLDLEAIFESNFIGTATSETILEGAERLVGDMNKRSEDLRLMAEHITGRAVESCVVVFDGVQGTDILMSHQIEFATEGPHYDDWVARQADLFAGAREAAADVLEQELGREPQADAE